MCGDTNVCSLDIVAVISTAYWLTHINVVSLDLVLTSYVLVPVPCTIVVVVNWHLAIHENFSMKIYFQAIHKNSLPQKEPTIQYFHIHTHTCTLIHIFYKCTCTYSMTLTLSHLHQMTFR